MSIEIDDRVLVKPLGVKGTVVRVRADCRMPRVTVQADSGGPPLPWLEIELEKLSTD